jgi:hypothetical protein
MQILSAAAPPSIQLPPSSTSSGALLHHHPIRPLLFRRHPFPPLHLLPAPPPLSPPSSCRIELLRCWIELLQRRIELLRHRIELLRRRLELLCADTSPSPPPTVVKVRASVALPPPHSSTMCGSATCHSSNTLAICL